MTKLELAVLRELLGRLLAVHDIADGSVRRYHEPAHHIPAAGVPNRYGRDVQAVAYAVVQHVDVVDRP